MLSVLLSAVAQQTLFITHMSPIGKEWNYIKNVTDRQTDMQTDRQTDRMTDGQNNRQTDRTTE